MDSVQVEKVILVSYNEMPVKRVSTDVQKVVLDSQPVLEQDVEQVEVLPVYNPVKKPVQHHIDSITVSLKGDIRKIDDNGTVDRPKMKDMEISHEKEVKRLRNQFNRVQNYYKINNKGIYPEQVYQN